jgi:hypothetical protein
MGGWGINIHQATRIPMKIGTKVFSPSGEMSFGVASFPLFLQKDRGE